ncbi:MAG: hypothetical protein FWJ73_02535 [Limnochordales bacterium]
MTPVDGPAGHLWPEMDAAAAQKPQLAGSQVMRAEAAVAQAGIVHVVIVNQAFA